MVQVLLVLASTVSERLHGSDRERGATAVEYGLIVALIAAIIVGVVGFLGTDVLNGFNAVEDKLGGSQG